MILSLIDFCNLINPITNAIVRTARTSFKLINPIKKDALIVQYVEFGIVQNANNLIRISNALNGKRLSIE